MAGQQRAARPAGPWRWRVAGALASVVLLGSVALGLTWLFSDPRPDSRAWLEVLSWRAGVVGMFSGTVLGGAGLVISALTLRAQKRAESQPAPTDADAVLEPESKTGASGNTPPPAQPPGPSQPATTAGKPEHASSGPSRSYGGDHIEFQGGTFHGQVIAKQVNPPAPKNPLDPAQEQKNPLADPGQEQP